MQPTACKCQWAYGEPVTLLLPHKHRHNHPSCHTCAGVVMSGCVKISVARGHPHPHPHPHCHPHCHPRYRRPPRCRHCPPPLCPCPCHQAWPSAASAPPQLLLAAGGTDSAPDGQTAAGNREAGGGKGNQGAGVNHTLTQTHRHTDTDTETDTDTDTDTDTQTDADTQTYTRTHER